MHEKAAEQLQAARQQQIAVLDEQRTAATALLQQEGR